MKARTVSLIAKAVGFVMVAAVFVDKAFLQHTITAMETLVFTGAILMLFGDVSLNLIIEKFTGLKIPSETPASAAGDGK